jgi:hypothetical protein
VTSRCHDAAAIAPDGSGANTRAKLPKEAGEVGTPSRREPQRGANRADVGQGHDASEF